MYLFLREQINELRMESAQKYQMCMGTNWQYVLTIYSIFISTRENQTK